MQWQEILQRQANWQRSTAEAFRLTVEEAVVLYDDAPLHALMQAAHQRRLTMHPEGYVTYLVDRNINYTNVCTINCQFCSFYRPPGHDETYTQSYEEISSRVRELEAIDDIGRCMRNRSSVPASGFCPETVISKLPVLLHTQNARVRSPRAPPAQALQFTFPAVVKCVMMIEGTISMRTSRYASLPT